jgi:hypothetical protein
VTNYPLQLAAVTSHPRHFLVAQLTEVLNNLGSVLDSHQFSNLALAIQFEISAQKVSQLRSSLLALPMSFSNSSITALEAIEKAQDSELPAEILGIINITFAHNEPDLLMHIPAVPG